MFLVPISISLSGNLGLVVVWKTCSKSYFDSIHVKFRFAITTFSAIQWLYIFKKVLPLKLGSLCNITKWLHIWNVSYGRMMNWMIWRRWWILKSIKGRDLSGRRSRDKIATQWVPSLTRQRHWKLCDVCEWGVKYTTMLLISIQQKRLPTYTWWVYDLELSVPHMTRSKIHISHSNEYACICPGHLLRDWF